MKLEIINVNTIRSFDAKRMLPNATLTEIVFIIDDKNYGLLWERYPTLKDFTDRFTTYRPENKKYSKKEVANLYKELNIHINKWKKMPALR